MRTATLITVSAASVIAGAVGSALLIAWALANPDRGKVGI